MNARLYVLGLTACLLAGGAVATPYVVVVDSPALVGSTGFLAFDLLAGSAGPGNEVAISAFSTNGVLRTGTGLGAVSGNLVPGPLRISSATSFFNQWLQPLTYGTQMRFQFEWSPGLSGATPDNFSFYLLNSSQVPLVTSDPTGANAVFSLNIQAASPPQVYASALFATTVTVVPEPHAGWLAALGLAGLLARVAKRLAGRG